MTDRTIYVRQDIEKRESFAAVLEYIRHHSDSFVSWKNYINHLVENISALRRRSGSARTRSKNGV